MAENNNDLVFLTVLWVGNLDDSVVGLAWDHSYVCHHLSSTGVGGSSMSSLTDLAVDSGCLSGHFGSPPHGLLSSTRVNWASLLPGGLWVPTG